MTESSLPPDVSSIAARRQHLADLRRGVAERLQSEQSATSICKWYSDRIDHLLIAILRHSFAQSGLGDKQDGFVLACVGGNGRRRPAPYSDVDLLLVTGEPENRQLGAALQTFIRDCWDTGLELGHSIRTPADVVSFATDDIQFATSLIDMRRLTGCETLFDTLVERLQRRVFRDRTEHFVNRCVAARREEWQARGDSVNQLEPDVKKSPGGLRDLHLLRWISFVRHGDAEPATLLQHNLVRTQELAAVQIADDFLTELRLKLHCRTGLRQDVLTRELQLELAREGGNMPLKEARSAAAQFMQEYFRRTSAVAEISRRLSEGPRSASLLSRLKNALSSRRSLRGFPVRDNVICVEEEGRRALPGNADRIMQLFAHAAEYQLTLSPDLRLEISRLVSSFPDEPSRTASKHFRSILRSQKGLPGTLRLLHETGVLDWLLPPFAEIRCLIQFNQYHSYTVDEHTLKTIDEVVSFEDDDTPLGSTYRSIRHKATLHLSLLMHDIGKGREGDHSVVGEQLCDEVGVRLQTAEHKKQIMRFLVRRHLVMPDLALRRDSTDPALLTDFARMVGSPERLRMLYVLSAADIRAVGPGVWTDWKADLLADLFNRTMEVISGRPWDHLEQERLKIVRDHVREAIVPIEKNREIDWSDWVDKQLDALPAFYLMTEDPQRIAQDLDIIQTLNNGVRSDYDYDPECDTVTYRIFASGQYESGCFHKIAGMLSGLRNDIHSATSCTTAGGTVIAGFVVTDNDFTGAVPKDRMRTVAQAVTDALTGKQSVQNVFRRSSLFLPYGKDQSLVYVDPQVCFDNDCSEQHTVIDVFAMDAPGLLYTLSETLFQHNLSVRLARIGTNVDQVVDVFYVTDQHGNKITDQTRIDWITADLLDGIATLQAESEPAS